MANPGRREEASGSGRCIPIPDIGALAEWKHIEFEQVRAESAIVASGTTS
jgi:hypothetical protein